MTKETFHVHETLYHTTKKLLVCKQQPDQPDMFLYAHAIACIGYCYFVWTNTSYSFLKSVAMLKNNKQVKLRLT